MDAKRTTRTALYLRISLDQTGEGLAVERQRKATQRLARQRGWQVVSTFEEAVSAAGKKTRPQFAAMLDAIARGEIDAVVAWQLDRLARNARDRLALVEACREHDVIIALVQGSDMDPTTASGRMTIGILGEVAEHEIAVKSERQTAAAHQRAEKGRPPLGTRLTGYTPQGEVVPDEAELVRRVFKMFVAGETLRSISRALTDENVATRTGRPWNPSSIRGILTNPRYAGRAIYQGKTTGQQGNWEPLVSGDVFDVTQARLTDPRRVTNREGTDRKHLGSGLYLCAVCDEPVSSWSQGRYRCRNGAHVNRAQKPVDDWVRTVIAARLRREDAADLLKPAAADLQPLFDQLDRLRERQAATDADYDADLIDGLRYRSKTARTQAEMAEVQRQLASWGTPGALADALAAPDPAAAFLDAGLMTQRAIVDALCTVRLHPGHRYSRVFDESTVQIKPR